MKSKDDSRAGKRRPGRPRKHDPEQLRAKVLRAEVNREKFLHPEQLDGDVSSEGIRLPLEAVPRHPGAEREPPQAGDTTQTSGDDKLEVCKFCGREYSRIGQHEAKCPHRPQVTVEITLTADNIALLLETLFDSFTKTHGPHWKLAKEEAEKLGLAWKQAADALLPALMESKWSVLLLALTNTLLILYPRVMLDAELRRQGATSSRWQGGHGKDVAAPGAMAGVAS